MDTPGNNHLTALIIDGDSSRRESFQQVIINAGKFEEVLTAIHLNDAIKTIKSNDKINYIFLSSDLNKDKTRGFFTKLKDDLPSATYKIILTVVPSPDTRRKTIETAISLGIDAMLFRPHTTETATQMIDSLEKATTKFGTFSPLNLFVKETMEELDVMASMKAGGEKTSEIFTVFKERMFILRTLAPDDLETYYVSAIDLFMNSVIPQKRAKVSYSGASKRVSHMLRRINSQIDSSE